MTIKSQASKLSNEHGTFTKIDLRF